MATVADQLEQDSRDRQRSMTPAQRYAEALSLGQAAIMAYASANAVSREEARRRLEVASQAGRRPSAVMRGLVE